MGVERSEVGSVAFYLVWVWDSEKSEPIHKYEATVMYFDDRVEILRIVDTEMLSPRTVAKNSPAWMRVTAHLSSRGLMEVKKCSIS